MNLEVYNKDDKLVCALDDDEALLGSYPVDNGFRIHVSLLIMFESGKANERADELQKRVAELSQQLYETEKDRDSYHK